MSYITKTVSFSNTNEVACGFCGTDFEKETEVAYHIEGKGSLHLLHHKCFNDWIFFRSERSLDVKCSFCNINITHVNGQPLQEYYQVLVAQKEPERLAMSQRANELYIAVRTGNLIEVRQLLTQPLNDHDRGMALIDASELGHLEIVQELSHSTIPIQYRVEAGIKAINNNHYLILKRLVSTVSADDVDPTLSDAVKISLANSHNILASHIVEKGDLDLLQMLLRIYSDKKVHKSIIQQASAMGHIHIVEKLLEGSDLEKDDLVYATELALNNENLEILRILLQYGLNDEERNSTWELIKVSSKQHLPAISKLLYLHIRDTISDYVDALE